MLKAKLLRWSALLVAIVGLLAATDVMAQLQGCSVTGYTIQPSPDPNTGQWPIPSGSSFEFRYMVTGDLSRILQVEFALEKEVNIVGADINNYRGACVGGLGTNKFGQDICPVRILSLPASSIANTGIRGFLVDSSTFGNGGGVNINANKGGGHCSTLSVPLRSGSLSVFVSIVPKLVEINGVQYCIDVDPQVGCPPQGTAPYVCGTNPKQFLAVDSSFQISSSAAGTHGLKYNQGADGNPSCPVGKIVGGSPDCEWITIGGTPYGPVCFD